MRPVGVPGGGHDLSATGVKTPAVGAAPGAAAPADAAAAPAEIAYVVVGVGGDADAGVDSSGDLAPAGLTGGFPSACPAPSASASVAARRSRAREGEGVPGSTPAVLAASVRASAADLPAAPPGQAPSNSSANRHPRLSLPATGPPHPPRRPSLLHPAEAHRSPPLWCPPRHRSASPFRTERAG